jgi:hypothetical protein
MSRPCTICATCRVMLLTTQEFMLIAGEEWSQSFRSRLGLQAKKLHEDILGKPTKKKRSSSKLGFRNKVGVYPCGILEQAYRLVKAKAEAEAPKSQG